jgi:hypothetical protein
MCRHVPPEITAVVASTIRPSGVEADTRCNGRRSTDGYRPGAMPDGLRVGVLTEMSPWSASTRHRALQHVPRLRARLGEVELLVADDEVVRPPGRIGQMRYFGTHALRYARRWRGLRYQLRRFDAVLVQRGLYVMGPGWIARELERFGGRVVYDLDDAVFSIHPELALKGPAARWLYGPQQARRLTRRANAVVVSTEEIARVLPEGTAAHVVLPTVPDVAVYEQARHVEQPGIVGWAGTSGGVMYLDPLREVFADLQAQGLGELEVVSSRPWTGPSRFRPWRIEDEPSLFARFAVGIMPLPDTPYTRGKAGFKLLQYMSAGVPVVASPVGVNSELVEQSGGGYLATGPAEWRDALARLLGDPGLRAEMGARGRAFVERYADLDRQADVLAGLLRGDRAR